MNQLTALADTMDSRSACAVTCDANNNIAPRSGDFSRRTFRRLKPPPPALVATEGDKRELWGATLRPRLFGRPMGKASNTAWSTGTVSVAQNTHMNPVTSRLAFEGTVSSSDYSRITDAREKGRIGIFGTGLSYAGGSGRVTSEILGRDLNPLGRGDGIAYLGGALNLGAISPGLPRHYPCPGTGNSVNNGCDKAPHAPQLQDCVSRTGHKHGCWCDCCMGGTCSDTTPVSGNGNPMCCPKACSAKTTCSGSGPGVSWTCSDGQKMTCMLDEVTRPPFCSTEKPPVAWDARFESCQHVKVNIINKGSWCDTNDIKDHLEKTFRTAISELLNCFWLSQAAGERLLKYCLGQKINIICNPEGNGTDNNNSCGAKHLKPKEAGVIAYSTSFGQGCDSQSPENQTLFVCPHAADRNFPVSVFAHEMLHICDCGTNKTRNSNPACMVTDGSQGQDFYAEGYAESCTACCYGEHHSYKLSNQYSPCCMCLACSSAESST